MKIKNVLILSLFALLGVGSFFYTIKVNNLNKEINKWQNQAASLDSISHYYKTVSEKMSLKVDEISSENKKLNSLLKKKDETIQSQVHLIGMLTDSLMNVATKDSIIYVDSSMVQVRTFDENVGNFWIAGYFETHTPYSISFTNLSALVDLEINITENKNDTYKVYVYSKDKKFTINYLEPQVIPYRKTFWEKLNFGIGFLGAKEFISIYTHLYYSHYSLIAGFSNKGFLLGTEYLFRR